MINEQQLKFNRTQMLINTIIAQIGFEALLDESYF